MQAFSSEELKTPEGKELRRSVYPSDEWAWEAATEVELAEEEKNTQRHLRDANEEIAFYSGLFCHMEEFEAWAKEFAHVRSSNGWIAYDDTTREFCKRFYPEGVKKEEGETRYVIPFSLFKMDLCVLLDGIQGGCEDRIYACC